MKPLTRASLIALDDYGRTRQHQQQRMMAMKKHRRVFVGPIMTLLFENFDTLWYQTQEMLWVEKGGEKQIEDELTAYAPLVPQGRELVATLMIEIIDPEQRRLMLRQLTHVERHVHIIMEHPSAPIILSGHPEEDVERTRSDGKTSAVHFLRFPFEPKHISLFQNLETKWSIGVDHPHYAYQEPLSLSVREHLALDFDR